MTALCGGGTSAPRAGVAETLVLTGSTLPGFLTEIGIPWAVPLVGLLDVFTYEVVSGCATDPPADPGITASDVRALLNVDLDILARNNAAAKFTQLLERFIWYQLCECTSTSTPAAPTPPAAPTGAPVVDPTYIPGAPAGACGSVTRTATLPGTSTSSTLANVSVPSGATSVRVTTTLTPNSTNYGFTTFNYGLYTDVPLSSPLFDGTGIDSFTLTFPTYQHVKTTALQPGALTMTFGFGSGPSGGHYPNNSLSVLIEFFCGGPTGNTAGGCCPPDPSIVAALNQILGYVTLLQRQIAPFAYVPGSSHAGLTGSGELDVQGLVGAKILVTTMPGWVGVEDGDPIEYRDAGWFSWGTADGFMQREYLTHAPHLTLPANAGALTKLGYSWSPGVVATVTELVRES
jgi:hypothetical protein